MFMLNKNQKLSLIYKQILNGNETVELFSLLIKNGFYYFEKNDKLYLKINDKEYFFEEKEYNKINNNFDKNINFVDEEYNNKLILELTDLPNIDESKENINKDKLLMENQNNSIKKDKINNNQNKVNNNQNKKINQNNKNININNKKEFDRKNKININNDISSINENRNKNSKKNVIDNSKNVNALDILDAFENAFLNEDVNKNENIDTDFNSNKDKDNRDNDLEKENQIDSDNNNSNNNSNINDINDINNNSNSNSNSNNSNNDDKNYDDEDLIGDDGLIEEMDIEIDDVSSTDNKQNYYVKRSDLSFEKYIVKYLEKDKTSDNEIDIEKEYEIFISPIDLEKNSMGLIPIFVLAKFEDESVPYVSINRKRPSVQGKIKNNSFGIRGRMNDYEFDTLFYPQNAYKKPTSINVEKYKPKDIYSIGHTVLYFDDLIFHVLPLSNENNVFGMVDVLVCLEDKETNKFLVEKTNDNIVQFMYKNKIYKITAQWKDNILFANVKN